MQGLEAISHVDAWARDEARQRTRGVAIR
jgi:hypothetical protein